MGVPTYNLIKSTVLTSDTATVTLSDIPTGYTNFRIHISSKLAAGGPNNPRMQFNSDSGANYGWRWFGSNPNTGAYNGGGASSQTQILWGAIANSAWANTVIDVFAANSTDGTTRKTVLSYSGVSGGIASGQGQAQWAASWSNKTDAITSITFNAGSTDSFATGTMFDIYGIASA